MKGAVKCRRPPLKRLGFAVKITTFEEISTSALTSFIIENVGPLKTFLDVLLLHQNFLRSI